MSSLRVIRVIRGPYSAYSAAPYSAAEGVVAPRNPRDPRPVFRVFRGPVFRGPPLTPQRPPAIIGHTTMTRVFAICVVAAALAGMLATAQEADRSMPDVRLMTVDPGHFHAALVQKEMYPGVAQRVDVYAPLGADLYEHLKRIDSFNRRTDRPTTWQTEIHASPDFFERMLREHPGNVVVLSGRNRGKIDRIVASVNAGLNVLADKPWILRSEDLPKVEQALAEADKRGLVAYDIMTERFEVTTILQRALVNDRATFGELVKGTEAEPAVYMESVHNLMKVVAGAPNIRPAWFFDTAEQGEGFNDIGTHLVDLVQWTLFPDQAIDYHADVRVLAAQRWPTWISESDFQRVTGEAHFPQALTSSIKVPSESSAPKGSDAPHDSRLEYLLQHARVLHRAWSAHQVERDLGLGGARGRRHPLRVLPGNPRSSRNSPDQGR